MKVLLDTDILLDVALSRSPHLEHSAAILQWVRAGGIAAVAWHSLANCSYILKDGREFLVRLLQHVEVAAVATRDARHALALPMADPEDAFQAAAAFAWGADLIVTRNLPDYKRSPVPAVSPAAFLKKIGR